MNKRAENAINKDKFYILNKFRIYKIRQYKKSYHPLFIYSILFKISSTDSL